MGRAGARWAASGREGKEGSAACSALWAEKKGMGRGKEKGRLGWNERRGRRGLKFSFFFRLFFKLFFKLCKLHSNNKTMQSNHNAQALIISNIIAMIFKYFKG
jgi:hypothetical protein